MKSIDPNSSIILLMHDVSRLIRNAIDAKTHTLGLTQTQWRTLVHIARQEGCKQSFIADILDITPISASRLLDRLESSGLIERRPDSRDRRAFRLFITNKAETILYKIKDYALEEREKALNGVSDEDIEIFIKTLSTMKSNLSN